MAGGEPSAIQLVHVGIRRHRFYMNPFADVI